MSEQNPARGGSAADDYGHLEPLFQELRALGEHDARRREIRDRLVSGYLPLAEHIARRCSGKGVEEAELVRVASAGFVHAVDRFDSERGSDFVSFAVPTVMAEVRRRLRAASGPRSASRSQEPPLAGDRDGVDLAAPPDRDRSAEDESSRYASSA